MIVNNDTIEKICFIGAYGHNVSEELTTEAKYEYDSINYGLKEIRRKKPVDWILFREMRDAIVSLCKNGVNDIIVNIELSHTLSSFPLQFLGRDYQFRIMETMWNLDMFEIYYKYPYGYAKIDSESIEKVEWKLDALRLYLVTGKGIRDAILSDNEGKLNDFKKQREKTIRQQEEAYANFNKECEIIKEQNKIKERERKKALREEAKRRMALEAKMENHEIYGEVLYRGEMFAIKSREDLEHLLQRMS